MTCDQDHGYTDEQSAADHGAEDAYPASVGHSLTLTQCLSGFNFNGSPETAPAGGSNTQAVLDYYDGNTVTALWNYAQHFAMSDNMYGTNYGPSTSGALNVTAAQTYGVICGPSSATINDPPCSAPPGLNTADPLSSNITTSAERPDLGGRPAGRRTRHDLQRRRPDLRHLHLRCRPPTAATAARQPARSRWAATTSARS